MKKYYRVYYNSKSDYPFVWSVDEGTSDTEINYRGVVIRAPSITIFNQYGQPHGWLSVCGELEVAADWAIIK